MHGITPFNDFHSFHARNPQASNPFSHIQWPNHFPFEWAESPFRSPPPFMMPPVPLFFSNMQPRMSINRSKIEYKETPEAHVYIAELPGMKREDVKVHVDEAKVLHISAQKKHENEKKEVNYHHVERGFGEFMSSFKLPPNSKPESVSTTCDGNGFLTVTVPKQIVNHDVEIHHPN